MRGETQTTTGKLRPSVTLVALALALALGIAATALADVTYKNGPATAMTWYYSGTTSIRGGGAWSDVGAATVTLQTYKNGQVLQTATSYNIVIDSHPVIHNARSRCRWYWGSQQGPYGLECWRT